MEEIKVKINPDFRTCKEVNSLGLEPVLKVNTNSQKIRDKYWEDLKAYKKAEENRRTFEIYFTKCQCTDNQSVLCDIVCQNKKESINDYLNFSEEYTARIINNKFALIL